MEIKNFKDLAEHLCIWPISSKDGITTTHRDLPFEKWESRCSRRVYKNTSCGAWLAFVDGGIKVGSIVEGVDQEAESITLQFPFTPDDLSNALQDIEDQCSKIWNNTHGCDECAKLWGMHDPEDGMPIEGYDGITPTHKDCTNPDCLGTGVVI